MKRKTIRNHKDFIISPNNIMTRCGFCLIKTKPAKIAYDARYGLIVPKRYFKLATKRNRAKRLIRDWIAYNEDLMSPNLDYVFILNLNILDMDREHGRQEIKKAFEKIAKSLKKSQKNNDEK